MSNTLARSSTLPSGPKGPATATCHLQRASVLSEHQPHTCLILCRAGQCHTHQPLAYVLFGSLHRNTPVHHICQSLHGSGSAHLSVCGWPGVPNLGLLDRLPNAHPVVQPLPHPPWPTPSELGLFRVFTSPITDGRYVFGQPAFLHSLLVRNRNSGRSPTFTAHLRDAIIQLWSWPAGVLLQPTSAVP